MWISISYVDKHFMKASEVSGIVTPLSVLILFLSPLMLWQARAGMLTLARKSFAAGLGRGNSKSSCW